MVMTGLYQNVTGQSPLSEHKINLLATDFFFNFSTLVFKMRVIQKPNKATL